MTTDYQKAVSQYFADQGWNTTLQTVRDGVYVVAGMRDRQEGTERLLVMVVTEPATDITREDFNHLASIAQKRDVGTMLLTATTGISNESKQMAAEIGAEIRSPGSLVGGEGDSPQADATRRSPAKKPASSSGASYEQQPRGGQQDRIAGQIQNLPLVKGAVYGAASYILGYVIFFALVLSIESDVTDAITEDQTQFVGWFYHNAQFVDVKLPSGRSFNYFDESSITNILTIPAIAYRVIPVIILVVTGYLLVNSLAVQTSEQGAKFGATIAVGVAVLAAVGSLVFTVSQGGQSASPQLLTSVLIMGMVYPALFGAIGGYLAGS